MNNMNLSELGLAKKTNATAYYIDVTPALAKAWLNNNIDNNRHIRPSLVWKYAYDMKNGNWGINTDAIAFNAAGELINGQHRLSAVVRANATITMLVVFDCPIGQNDLMNIDRGGGRSIADSMEVAGYTDDVFVRSVPTARAYITCKLGIKNPSQQTITKHIVENKEIYARILEITKAKKNGKGKMRGTVAAALLGAYSSGEDFNALAKFAQVFMTYETEGCEEYSPKYALRLKDKIESHHGLYVKDFPVIESHIYAFVHNTKTARIKDNYYSLNDNTVNAKLALAV